MPGIATVKLALRMLAKSTSLSVTIVLTLALAIGANTAVFSAIYAILLRPLPFPEADQLVTLAQAAAQPNSRSVRTPIAPARLEDWNRLSSTFQAITGYYTEDVSETSGELPEKITRATVAHRFFQVWGISPVLGRAFVSEEEHLNGGNAVVISDRLWRRRFAADPQVLRKSLRLDGFSYRIVGVMPPSFLFPDRDVEVWSPTKIDFPMLPNRQLTWYSGVGRLKPGVTLDQARADLSAVQTHLGQIYPQPDSRIAPSMESLKESAIHGVRRSLWVVFGSVTLLLLLACANIASLLLARATQRTHEIAVRFSLGASRWSIVRQLLAEAFLLSLAGALVGLGVAALSSRAFRTLAAGLPRADEIRLDEMILLYCLVCASVATILCGLLPAMRASRLSLAGRLATAGRTQVSGRNPLQWTLVGFQVALAVTLLTGAGLLLRSFQALGRVSPGFEPSHVLTLRISGNYGETGNYKGLAQRMERTLDALREVPGVTAAAISISLPGVPIQFLPELKISGIDDPNRKITVYPRYVSDGYFATMQIPVLAGEGCQRSVLPQAVVNRAFADTYFSGSSAIGQHVSFRNPNMYAPPPAEIRGIVGDTREQGLSREPVPTVYWCVTAGDPVPAFLIRTAGRPMSVAETIRRKIREIEPRRSVFDVMPLEDHLGETLAENRLRTVLLTFFALTAVALACIGLYGTLSYFVSVRRREIGLRLALGAVRKQIVWQFVFQGLRVALLGCAAGLLLAGAFGRAISSFLFGISAGDAVTFAGVPLLALGTAVFSSLAPALRAARVEPMQVLRDE
jgi:putative ABC transport system permease protein